MADYLQASGEVCSSKHWLQVQGPSLVLTTTRLLASGGFLWSPSGQALVPFEKFSFLAFHRNKPYLPLCQHPCSMSSPLRRESKQLAAILGIIACLLPRTLAASFSDLGPGRAPRRLVEAAQRGSSPAPLPWGRQL